MNQVQQWLNDKALDILIWLWNFISTVSFWVCANGIVVCFLIYFCSKSKGSLQKASYFVIYFLLIFVLKCAIVNAN